MIPSVYTPFRAIDIYTLKLLHKLVPIVLIVARSDGLNQKERRDFKTRIAAQIDELELNVYSPSPFFTISKVESGVRTFPFGDVRVADESYSDLGKLRKWLLERNLYNLINQTDEYHYWKIVDNFLAYFLKKWLNIKKFFYEEYRQQLLESKGFKDNLLNEFNDQLHN